MRHESRGAETERRASAAIVGKCFAPFGRYPRRYSSLIPKKAMARGWDPIRDLVGLQDRMNRLFQEAAQQRRERVEEEADREIERADWLPPADISESDSEHTIWVDLPGVERAALEISLDNDRLLIRGERAIEYKGQHRVERPHGRFQRSFGVPSNVDQKAIAAEYKDGVLRVRLPKNKEQKGKKVEIKVS